MVGMVIRYNRKTGDRIVREYPGPNGYANAVYDPDFRKDMGKHLGDWELAVIGSDSFDAIRTTHSRYFTGRDVTPVHA